jgi:hypothetical protein
MLHSKFINYVYKRTKQTGFTYIIHNNYKNKEYTLYKAGREEKYEEFGFYRIRVSLAKV